jgi:hypothetical protein
MIEGVNTVKYRHALVRFKQGFLKSTEKDKKRLSFLIYTPSPPPKEKRKAAW